MVGAGRGSRVWSQAHHLTHRQTDNTFGPEDSEQVHKPSEERVNCFYFFFYGDTSLWYQFHVWTLYSHYFRSLYPCACPSGNHYPPFSIYMLLFGTTSGNVNWCTNNGNSMETAQKINSNSSMWPSYPTYLSKEHKNTHQQKQRQPYVHHNVIYNRRDMEAT